jgi:hypothetical protein
MIYSKKFVLSSVGIENRRFCYTSQVPNSLEKSMQTTAQAQQQAPVSLRVHLASPISQGQMSPEQRAELHRLVEELASECTAFSYAPLREGLLF